MFHSKAPRKLLLFLLLCLIPTQALAAPTAQQRLETNRAKTIDTNLLENWPTGPVVGSSSAILMELKTGTILYSKNIHEKHYPASTTKILTTLIAANRCKLDEIVTFSHDAVFDTPRDSNHIAMDVGDTLTMEQCLNAILIRSANEVSFAVAEHISGTSEEFALLMNEEAKKLGCVDSNFVNPNGLPDEEHYTSAYDLAKIGQAFFANDMLCNMSVTPRLIIPKEKEDLIENNKMELIPGGKRAYEFLKGIKTGYTDVARYTIAAAAEKNGMTLICVLMEDEYPELYEDTIALFNYGFSNFSQVTISSLETKYNIDDQGLFYSDNDLFGSSSPILSLDKTSTLILPKTIDFRDVTSKLVYLDGDTDQVARVDYTYKNVPLGSASIQYARSSEKGYAFEEVKETDESKKKWSTSFIFINILTVLGIGLGIVFVVILILMGYAFTRRYHFSFPGRERRAWKKNRRRARKMEIREARRHSRQNYRERKKRRRRY